MLDAEEREVSSRSRLDLLLEQLGVDVVSETLEVEIEALSRLQSGVAPLEGGVLERMNALGKSMGMTVDWWEEEIPLSDVGGVELKEPEVALEEELPAAGVSSRSRSWAENLEERRLALRRMHRLAQMTQHRLGMRYQGTWRPRDGLPLAPWAVFSPLLAGGGTFIRSWPRKRLSGPLRPGRRPDQALRERPVGLVRSLLQIRQTLGPDDVDVEVLDVDVVRRRGQRLRSSDCPG